MTKNNPNDSSSKERKTKWMDKKWFVRLLSLVLAIACWFIANLTDTSANFPYAVEEVPINVEPMAEVLSTMDLSIIEVTPSRVTANVKGDRSTIANLDPSVLTAILEFNQEVVGPGTYEFDLTPSNPTSASMGNLFQIGSYSPETVKLKLDRMETRTLAVDLVMDGDPGTPEGYIRESETITPSKIKLTGPKVELDKIARCVVSVSFDRPLEKTLASEFPIQLLDAEGNVIDPEAHHIIVDHTTAQVAIRILQKDEIPLKIEFINLPRGLSEEDIHYTMSNYEIAVAGPPEMMERYNEIILDYLEIQNVSKENSEFTYDIELPEGISNLENLNSVTVSFDTSNWTEKTFTIPAESIRFVNTSNRYKVSLVSDALYNVTFFGEAEAIEALEPEDIIAEVDLSEKELILGQYQHPVRISAPNKGFLWATGDYSVVIQVNEVKEE